MIEQLYSLMIREQNTVRGVQRMGRDIYRTFEGIPGKKWQQGVLQHIISERKTELRGGRPARRARRSRSSTNSGDMSW